jgi:hypothetical protein
VAGETRQLGTSAPIRWEIGPLTSTVADAFVRDFRSPDFYFVASLTNGAHFVPQNHCPVMFDLTNGDAIIDTQPHINVRNSEAGE